MRSGLTPQPTGLTHVILAGPRGIGKTAVLLAFGDICRESHYEVINLQAAAGNAGLIDSVLGEARERIESGAGAWQRAKRAFERIGAVNVNVAGFGAAGATRLKKSRRHCCPSSMWLSGDASPLGVRGVSGPRRA
jgi:hypothetical protein